MGILIKVVSVATKEIRIRPWILYSRRLRSDHRQSSALSGFNWRPGDFSGDMPISHQKGFSPALEECGGVRLDRSETTQEYFGFQLPAV